MYSEPLSTVSGIGGTGPEEFPKLTMRPNGCRQSSEAWNVSLPTAS
jgi:hypothetical protein